MDDFVLIELEVDHDNELKNTPARPRAEMFGFNVGQLLRLLYNQNPFYVVSALLVFSGLWQSFTENPDLVEAGAIAVGLAAYAVLLALTAWLIIHLGRVWDDARSLLLLIVLMFLAISVSSDPVLNAEEQPGTKFVLAGFLFSVTVSELLLRHLPLRLPALYRLPYYGVLALFFLYPLAMNPVLHREPGPVLYWALFGFSSAAGVVFLALLPALRRGAAYVRDSGSPWAWPAYPWALFGMLSICVCLRAYFLCVSFHAILGTESIFGPYFLVPFLFSLAVLLLEASVVAQSQRMRRIALIVPIAILSLCVVGHHADATYQDFLTRFTLTFSAAPLFVGLCAAMAYYGYAMARRIAGALDAFTFALAAFAVVPPATLDIQGVEFYTAWPLIAAGVIQAIAGVARRESFRTTMACAVMLVAINSDSHLAYSPAFHGVVLWHAAILIVLAVGACFADSFASLLRVFGAGLLACSCLAAAMLDPQQYAPLPAIVVQAYPLVPIAVAFIYGRFVGGPLYYAAAAAGGTGWVASWVWNGYRHAREHVAGLNQVVWGIVFFAVAAILSLTKAGIWSRFRSRDRAVTP